MGEQARGQPYDVKEQYEEVISLSRDMNKWISTMAFFLNTNSFMVSDSSNDQTSTDSKAPCTLKGISGRAKRLQKFIVIGVAKSKHEHYNYQKLQTIK